MSYSDDEEDEAVINRALSPPNVDDDEDVIIPRTDLSSVSTPLLLYSQIQL